MKNNIPSIISVLLLGGVLQAFAGDETSKEISTATPEVPAFRHGAQEVELLSGAMLSEPRSTLRGPRLNYALEAVRYGWMLNDIHGPSILRGNEELLLEAFAGEVFTGPGHGFGGGMLILRHNFVQEGSRLVPYLQIGGGCLDNDIYHDQVQHRIGEAFEFTLHGGLGVRWMITDHWAISTELDYRHISNADLARRNGGLDSVGGLLGVNFLF